jgi:hypothetical protein
MVYIDLMIVASNVCYVNECRLMPCVTAHSNLPTSLYILAVLQVRSNVSCLRPVATTCTISAVANRWSADH